MSSLSNTSRKTASSRLVAFFKQTVNSRQVPYGLGVLAVAWAVATYWVLSTDAFATASDYGTLLIFSNLALFAALAVLVTRRAVRLRVERRAGTAGSRLHVRLVTLLCLVAIIPTILVALFSAQYFDRQVENEINPEVRSAVDNSVTISEDYFEEHKRNAALALGAMASALKPVADFRRYNRLAFDEALAREARTWSFSEAIILDDSGRIFAKYDIGTTLGADAPRSSLPRPAIQEAKRSPGTVVRLVDNEREDTVRALVRLDTFPDLYLYGGRTIDQRVMDKLEQTREHAATYAEKEAEREAIQQDLTSMFIVIALMMLMGAILVGMWFATQTVAPISSLVRAAERVREGDLSIRVAEGENDDDEISVLSRTFNRMTDQLQGQRSELIDANQQLDDRRRFTEAVLGGVSVGVVGLNERGEVDLPNRAALAMLEVAEPDLIGKRLVGEVPELTELLAEALEQPQQLIQQQINIIRGGVPKNLLVRISTETVDQRITGFVVTFDDITELVEAQRTAAWADVARRIAHEIKNPLTPIQLSAERLKRKYHDEVASDPDVFSHCTDTIIRQVGDIRRMVDEFSGFARMPAPTFRPESLSELVRQTVLFLEVSSPQIAFAVDIEDETIMLTCDGRQVAQALTNVIKNAVESVEARLTTEGPSATPGRLEITVRSDEDRTVVHVDDNGRGLPGDRLDRLTEPYVTTREKGTGLGLAIVKKIMSDHGGELILEDRPQGGARATLSFSHAHLEELVEGSATNQEREMPALASG